MAEEEEARTRRGERVGEAVAVRRWRRRRVESIGVGGRVRGRGRWEKTGAEAAGDMWTASTDTCVDGATRSGSWQRAVLPCHLLDAFVLVMFSIEKKNG